MYTKTSHASTLPCFHVYPDYVKVTFNSENPTPEQIHLAQRQWVSEEPQSLDFITVEKLPENTVHIYVCTHASRDQRCGAIGRPTLSTLSQYIASPPSDIEAALQTLDIQCMATSHVGGHNIAGNMIIYRPGWKQGIWYGRVSPCDVDDIIRETVVGGKILARYWRGGLPNGMWDPKQHISGEEA